VYDLHGKEDVPDGSASMLNRAEAQFVLCLYKDMQASVAELREGTASVAVISPYKAQVRRACSKHVCGAGHERGCFTLELTLLGVVAEVGLLSCLQACKV
jgi:hypothetical protein